MMKIKNNHGFTLVELMIVISIIGILSAVSATYFSQYQAKARSVEAKIQLAGVYAVQNTFYSEFGIYSNCLQDMGFQPVDDVKRYYAIGFPTITSAISASAYAQANQNGLAPGDCPRLLAPEIDRSYYLATIGTGSVIVNSLAIFSSGVINSSNALDETTATNSLTMEEGLGDMNSNDTQAFSVVSAGYIHKEFSTPTQSSLMSINHLKQIRIIRTGY